MILARWRGEGESLSRAQVRENRGRNTRDGDHRQIFCRTRGMGKGVGRTPICKPMGKSQSGGWRQGRREGGKEGI